MKFRAKQCVSYDLIKKEMENKMQLYHSSALGISRLITKSYSSSFYIATCCLDRSIRDSIFSIYGFVRYADEIVDSFHDFDKEYLLNKFEHDLYEALSQGISLNPVLHSFQRTVKKYEIEDQHIQAFLKSMKADLSKQQYTNVEQINEYIYGSADVVGLMCLKVFCNGDDALYHKLQVPAMKLGSAFQKVNFLRDLREDIENLNRTYFPNVDKTNFNEKVKLEIVKEIENDFKVAKIGLLQLPRKSKLAVLIAYYYYKVLLNKIGHTRASRIIETRIRISNTRKIALLLKAQFVYKFNLLSE